jgi:hypothetical protein
LICAFVLFLSEAKSQGDTPPPLAQVSTGTVLLRGSGNPNGPFRFEGQGFVLNGFLDLGSLVPCGPCIQGQPQLLDSFFSGSSIRPGPAEIDGISYQRLYYEGWVKLEAGNITIPFAASVNQMFITTPFKLMGVIRACTTSTTNGCPQGWVFERALEGYGTAKVRLTNFNRVMNMDSRREYAWNNVSFTFLNASTTQFENQFDTEKN